jgi:superfamily II DNA or RNA helicase
MSSLFSTPGGALRPLRPHQERALDELRCSLASGHRRPMLQAPTGFGKTLTAAHIIQRALDKGKRVAFTVPALSLVDQTVAAFEAEGIHCVGVMQGIHERTDRDAPVQICSVQTLARRKEAERIAKEARAKKDAHTQGTGCERRQGYPAKEIFSHGFCAHRPRKP